MSDKLYDSDNSLLHLKKMNVRSINVFPTLLSPLSRSGLNSLKILTIKKISNALEIIVTQKLCIYGTLYV